VQGAGAPCGGVDEPGHGGGAVGAEDRLRGLDLDLEPEPSRGQPGGLLELRAQLGHRGRLGGEGHLRQGEHQPLRQRSGVQQRGQEEVEGADAAVAHGGFQALHADARIRGRGAVRHHGGQGPGRGQGGGVLLVVRATAVAVLEVDPQVLHRLAQQLGPYAVVHLGGEVPGQAEDRAQGGGVGRMGVEGGQRLVAPLADGPGGEGVGGDVDGVDGLAFRGLAGIAAGEFGVGGGERRADLGAYRIGQCGHGRHQRPPGVQHFVESQASRGGPERSTGHRAGPGARARRGPPTRPAPVRRVGRGGGRTAGAKGRRVGISPCGC